MMSKSLLDAARSQGGDLDATVLGAFESRRVGLLAQFGEADSVGELGIESLVRSRAARWPRWSPSVG